MNSSSGRSLLDTNVYQHQALDKSQKEIRLLNVYAGKAGAVLRCSLQHISLEYEHRPPYETISYAWGEGDETQQGLVDIDGFTLRCPLNAEQALDCLRFEDTDRLLWIDSICIDQDDIKERGHQVGIMHEIYQSSACNRAYLGKADNYTKRALDNLSELNEEMCRKIDQDLNVWEMVGRGLEVGTGLHTKLDEEALIQFFDRPWFQYESRGHLRAGSMTSTDLT